MGDSSCKCFFFGIEAFAFVDIVNAFRKPDAAILQFLYQLQRGLPVGGFVALQPYLPAGFITNRLTIFKSTAFTVFQIPNNGTQIFFHSFQPPFQVIERIALFYGFIIPYQKCKVKNYLLVYNRQVNNRQVKIHKKNARASSPALVVLGLFAEFCQNFLNLVKVFRQKGIQTPRLFCVVFDVVRFPGRSAIAANVYAAIISYIHVVLPAEAANSCTRRQTIGQEILNFLIMNPNFFHFSSSFLLVGRWGLSPHRTAFHFVVSDFEHTVFVGQLMQIFFGQLFWTVARQLNEDRYAVPRSVSLIIQTSLNFHKLVQVCPLQRSIGVDDAVLRLAQHDIHFHKIVLSFDG